MSADLTAQVSIWEFTDFQVEDLAQQDAVERVILASSSENIDGATNPVVFSEYSGDMLKASGPSWEAPARALPTPTRALR